MSSGFHNTWNQRIQHAHSSVWVFISHLKDWQTVAETTVDAPSRGAAVQSQNTHCWLPVNIYVIENDIVLVRHGLDVGLDLNL